MICAFFELNDTSRQILWSSAAESQQKINASPPGGPKLCQKEPLASYLQSGNHVFRPLQKNILQSVFKHMRNRGKRTLCTNGVPTRPVSAGNKPILRMLTKHKRRALLVSINPAFLLRRYPGIILCMRRKPYSKIHGSSGPEGWQKDWLSFGGSVWCLARVRLSGGRCPGFGHSQVC